MTASAQKAGKNVSKLALPAAEQAAIKRSAKAGCRLTEFDRQAFLITLFSKLLEQVEQGKLDKADRQLAADYAESLVLGDGSVPEGLSALGRQRVEFGFALGVVFWQEPGRPAGMSGQRADWASAAFEQARLLKAKRAKRRKAAQATAAA